MSQPETRLPDPTPVIDLIEAFRRSKAMFAAVELGVFDQIEKGPATAATLAAQMGADAGALERLLDACVGLGLLEKRETQYLNRPIAQTYLCRSSERTLAGYILYSSKVLFPLWAHLPDAVREGTHRWKQAFNLEGPIFDHFFQSDEALRTFILGMHGFGVLSSPAVVAAFDLSRFRKLADLGGATGHLAIAACERYPDLRAAVFDLPRVIEAAGQQVDRSPAASRVELIAGDFFKEPLPDADLFAVGRILHDWSEDKIRTLLGKIYNRLPRDGGLLIAEKLLDDDKNGPTPAHMQSLNMLVCTEGTERSLREYRALLEEAGFMKVEGRSTGAPLDAVLAVK
jgi:acetylserotonin N-methyltransferase